MESVRRLEDVHHKVRECAHQNAENKTYYESFHGARILLTTKAQPRRINDVARVSGTDIATRRWLEQFVSPFSVNTSQHNSERQVNRVAPRQHWCTPTQERPSVGIRKSRHPSDRAVGAYLHAIHQTIHHVNRSQWTSKHPPHLPGT